MILILEDLSLKTPVLGLYDVEDGAPFAPFTTIKKCIFSAYSAWMEGKSICLERNNCPCPGAGYWFAGVEVVPRSNFSRMLLQNGGFQLTEEKMSNWLEEMPHYQREHRYLILGPLREEQADFLKTVTLFVTADQFSGLLGCIEACKDTPHQLIVRSAFGAGCWELIAPCLLSTPEEPQAVIGITDVAMRQHIPAELLALTMNRTLWERLTRIKDEESPLRKSFWNRLQEARQTR